MNIADKLAEKLRNARATLDWYAKENKDDGDAEMVSEIDNLLAEYDAQRRRPIRVVVHLDGGIVQGTVADREGVLVIVVDYDAEGADPAEITDVPQDDGDTAEAVVGFWGPVVDAAWIERAIRAYEEQEAP